MSTSKDMRAAAEFERDLSATLNEEAFRIAVLLAPGFRDKFDLSNPDKDFEAWAEMAWKGAHAMIARKVKAMGEVNKEFQKASDAADRQELKEVKEEKLHVTPSHPRGPSLLAVESKQGYQIPEPSNIVGPEKIIIPEEMDMEVKP